MKLRLGLTFVVLTAIVSIALAAQESPKGPLMSGTVKAVGSGQPVSGAHVWLIRHATNNATHGESLEILAKGQTDETGRFSFGSVTLRNELEFPLEGSISIEYGIMKDGQSLRVIDANFSAPRRDSVITSIEANLLVGR